MHVCIYTYICICMCVHVCMYVRVCVCACVYGCMYVCMHVCTHICMYVYTFIIYDITILYVCIYLRIYYKANQLFEHPQRSVKESSIHQFKLGRKHEKLQKLLNSGQIFKIVHFVF